MEIKLDVMSTPYTIDTYSTYLSDSYEEQEIEYYNETNETDYNYDDFDWKYNHKGLVQHLADSLLEQMRENIIDDVILKIEADGEAWSPREYNFATDNASFIYTVNPEALEAYIADNAEAYETDKKKSYDGFWWRGDEDETRLAFYLEHKSVKDYTNEDNFYDQWDELNGNGVWHEFIDYELIKK